MKSRQKPSLVAVPKSAYIAERDRFYSDWSRSFWRELFQNSIDAGATRIHVDLEETLGTGSFGRPPRVDEVTRVTFSDDGCGMDEDVLWNVYFRTGETTKKDGNSTGGYGRARLMTCFSQVRYAIRTRDMLVEGDGPEFTCSTVEQAIEAQRQEIQDLEEELQEAALTGGEEKAHSIAGTLARLRSDLRHMEKLPTFQPGCVLEIDVNPHEYDDRPWRNVSAAVLRDTLHEYLSQAQLYTNTASRQPCKVFIDGQEWTERLSRGRAVRTLHADLEDGSQVELATVHVNKSPHAKHRGKVIFRIDGAPMLVRPVSSEAQVIVEINKQHSREFLTSNRDAFRERYEPIVSGFLEDLVVDQRSALQEEDRIKHTVVAGERGKIDIIQEVDLAETLSDEQLASVELPGGRSVAELTVEMVDENLPAGTVDAFMQHLREARRTFLDSFSDESERFLFQHRVEQHGDFKEAFRRASPELQAFLANQLLARSQQDGVSKDLHDIHIRSEDPTPAIRKAMRRYDPRRWDPKTGYGSDAMAMHAAWSTCCRHAVGALMRVAPNDRELDNGRVKIATGWLFTPATERWVGSDYSKRPTGAMHLKQGDTHVLLLNPVDDDGNKAYKLSDPADLQRMMVLAIHEAVHICARRHDEYWAELMTSISQAFDFQRSGKVATAVKEAIANARDVFRQGKTMVQESDPTPAGELRPWERLAAHGAPVATMVAGIASAPENEAIRDCAINQVYADCFDRSRSPDLVEVDCDQLSKLEASAQMGLKLAAEANAAPRPAVTSDHDLDADPGQEFSDPWHFH